MYQSILLIILAIPFLTYAQPIIMFPGDANNDGVANQYDILPIGIAYGQEGFPRPGATLDWIPQFHPNQWPDNLPVSGINYGFSDSDGNGLIDSLDIDAIALNFDSMQAASQPPPFPYLPHDTCFSCPKPDLLITFDKDTAMVNDTIFATLTLRYPASIPPEIGALGIAFELNYDPENVKDSLTKVFPDTMPGDLMFITATTTLARSWRTVNPGNIRFGAAGKGMNALFSTRIIGTVEFIVDDMIVRSTAVDFWMDAANILILNENEQVVCFGGVDVDTITLFDPIDAVGERPDWHNDINIFPNPASDRLTVESPNAIMEKVELFSINGTSQLVNWTGFSNKTTLDVNSFPTGIYLLNIQTEKGVLTKKIKVEN